MSTKQSRFTRRGVESAQKAVGHDPDTPVNNGDGGHAESVIVAIHCPRESLDQPYRRKTDVLREMPDSVDMLDLSVVESPDFTFVCRRKQALKKRVLRLLLRSSATLNDSGEIQPIDFRRWAHRSSSPNDAKRVEDTVESVNATPPVDYSTGAILDVHCVKTCRTNPSSPGKVLTGNLNPVGRVVADGGFD